MTITMTMTVTIMSYLGKADKRNGMFTIPGWNPANDNNNNNNNNKKIVRQSR